MFGITQGNLIAGVAALAIWLTASIFSGAPVVSVPLGLLMFVLVSQLNSQRTSRKLERERDELLPILESVVPKIEAGMSVVAAFKSAAVESPSPSSQRLNSFCFRMDQGTAEVRASSEEGPVLLTLFSMLDAAARQGGEVTRPFRALAMMLASDQRLTRKQQLATIQIRWQANVLILIAGGILVASALSHQEALVFLVEQPEGRLLVVASATLFLLGQIILNIIAARIAYA